MTIAMAALALNVPAAGLTSTIVGAELQPAAGTANLCVEAYGLGAMLAYGTLFSKVGAWENLPHNWDGEGGAPLSERTTAAALDFLAIAQGAGLRPPTPYIAGDGEVGFRWRTDKGLASIAFLADGHIVGKVPGGDKPFRIDEPFSEIADLAGLTDALVAFVA